jgi:hypothetical protein
MIPVIDLEPYLAARPHASAATAAELGRALQDVGFFFGTVLRLPPEQLARLHILPQSQIDAWLAAGHFHTVRIGTTDPRVQALVCSVATPARSSFITSTSSPTPSQSPTARDFGGRAP